MMKFAHQQWRTSYTCLRSPRFQMCWHRYGNIHDCVLLRMLLPDEMTSSLVAGNGVDYRGIRISVTLEISRGNYDHACKSVQADQGPNHEVLRRDSCDEACGAERCVSACHPEAYHGYLEVIVTGGGATVRKWHAHHPARLCALLFVILTNMRCVYLFEFAGVMSSSVYWDPESWPMCYL